MKHTKVNGNWVRAPKRMGRPPLPDGVERHQHTFRLDALVNAKLEELTKLLDRNRTYVLRLAIENLHTQLMDEADAENK